MIKTIKNFFKPKKYLVCPICGANVEGSCRVLSLNVDGTFGAYAVHRECELKLKEADYKLKLKKVKTLY
ncbi:hypothetical protein [Brachyspira murdochii]|uniref:Uncharacterized protein n=1 Tax=Brachyspira murdochii TaxID=84378 RepID=A0ABX5B8J4_9SPIR|nr:hypothetical protein [Brachyspira murdochii]PPS22968.1 hypothetical protein DJ52_01870 [Brachyspira murdochii]